MEPRVVQIKKDFYSKIKELQNIGASDKDILCEIYKFIKTYQYEPDVLYLIRGNPHKFITLVFTDELYKKLTGQENKTGQPIQIFRYLAYADFNEFINSYESKFEAIEIEYVNEPGRIYVVVGMEGLCYIENTEPIVAFESKQEAIDIVHKLNTDASSYYDVHFPDGNLTNPNFYIKSVNFHKLIAK